MKALPLLLFLLVSWQVQPGEKVAYYPGSFDPPHLGHLEEVINKALKSGISQVFIEPIKEARFFPYVVRLEMLKALENERIHLITSFDERLREGELYGLCGSDIICTHYSEIKANPCKLKGYLVNPRKEHPLSFELIESLKPLSITLLDEDKTHISSTKVRQHLRDGLSISHLVDPSTEELINIWQIYEELKKAKQADRPPQIKCPSYAWQDPLIKTIREILGTPDLKQLPHYSTKKVYKSGNKIVKVYPAAFTQECLNEILAIETLRLHQPKSFSLPSIVALHRIVGFGEIHHLLVENLAPGVHLDEANTMRAYSRFGEALAELHSLKKGKNKNEFLKRTKPLRHIPYSLKQKMFAARETSYTQFDVQVRNALYDEQTDQITLLDLATVALFLDKDFNPTAPPIYDYAAFTSQLDLEAKEAFIQGYEGNGGERFPKCLLDNYSEAAERVRKWWHRETLNNYHLTDFSRTFDRTRCEAGR